VGCEELADSDCALFVCEVIGTHNRSPKSRHNASVRCSKLTVYDAASAYAHANPQTEIGFEKIARCAKLCIDSR
jgi:hypothetical protein